MERPIGFIDCKTQHSENIKFPINFKEIPIKGPARVFVDINNLIIKWIANTALKEKQMWERPSYLTFSSIQLLSSVRSLQHHGLQHARLPCPSSIPRACSNSCPSSWWCHPTISSSVIPFNLSQHQSLFWWVSSLYQVAKYWSFSFSIGPSNEYSGLISFRIYLLDIFAVQGIYLTFKLAIKSTIIKTSR